MSSSHVRCDKRFLTENFILQQSIRTSDESALHEWQRTFLKRDADGKFIKDDTAFYYDSKNCIHCVNPTFDFTCYYNYMTLLNQLYDDWKYYGLFDQQYKPYIYFPTFWPTGEMRNQLIQLANRANVNLLKTRCISLMYTTSAFGSNEYWIHKTELAKLIKYCEATFADTFGVEPKGKFSFGSTDPDRVRPTQLFRVYSEIEHVR